LQQDRDRFVNGLTGEQRSKLHSRVRAMDQTRDCLNDRIRLLNYEMAKPEPDRKRIRAHAAGVETAAREWQKQFHERPRIWMCSHKRRYGVSRLRRPDGISLHQSCPYAIIGTILPCNVVVQETAGADIEVSAIDPVASMQAIENSTLAKTAEQVRARLRKVIESL
jgi:hypothetical protein